MNFDSTTSKNLSYKQEQKQRYKNIHLNIFCNRKKQSIKTSKKPKTTRYQQIFIDYLMCKQWTNRIQLLKSMRWMFILM